MVEWSVNSPPRSRGKRGDYPGRRESEKKSERERENMSALTAALLL